MDLKIILTNYPASHKQVLNPFSHKQDLDFHKVHDRASWNLGCLEEKLEQMKMRGEERVKSGVNVIEGYLYAYVAVSQSNNCFPIANIQ